MWWEDELPEHDRCEQCAEYVCPTNQCILTDDCMQVDNHACPSTWTAYQLVLHARCVPAAEAELEEHHVDSDYDDSAGLHP